MLQTLVPYNNLRPYVSGGNVNSSKVVQVLVVCGYCSMKLLSRHLESPGIANTFPIFSRFCISKRMWAKFLSLAWLSLSPSICPPDTRKCLHRKLPARHSLLLLLETTPEGETFSTISCVEKAETYVPQPRVRQRGLSIKAFLFWREGNASL